MHFAMSPSAAAYERQRGAQSVSRGLAAMAVEHLTGRAARETVAEHWPRDRLAGLVARGAVSPTSLSDFEEGTGSRLMFLSSVAPASAAMKLFDRAFDLDLDGMHEAVVTSVVVPSPAFVGEGQPIAMVAGTTTDATLGPLRKVLLGTAISRQLEFATPGSASALIGRALSQQAEKSLDAVLFDATAADDTSPAGLLSGVTPLAAASAATDFETMVADLASLAGALATAGADPERAMFFASPKQATKMKGMLGARFNHTIVSVAALADGVVMAIDPQGIGVAASGAPEISISTEAVAHFEDTSPAAIGTAGSPNTIAAPVRSAWQQDLLALKIRLRAAWAVLVPGAVQVIAETNW